MKWMGGRTLIGKALRYALDYELVVTQGNRVPDVPDIVVLLTDGLSQDNPLLAASLMRSSGVTVYAVGITEAVQDQQLANIAGSTERIYKILDFSHLDSRLRDQIVRDICKPLMKKPEVSPAPIISNVCSPSPYYSCPPDNNVKIFGSENSVVGRLDVQMSYGSSDPKAAPPSGNYDQNLVHANYANFEQTTITTTDQQQSFPSPPPFTLTVEMDKFKTNEFCKK